MFAGAYSDPIAESNAEGNQLAYEQNCLECQRTEKFRRDFLNVTSNTKEN